MTGFGAAAMSLTMIAAFLLAGFGVAQVRRAPTRQRGLLMIACAAVFAANVFIWTI